MTKTYKAPQFPTALDMNAALESQKRNFDAFAKASQVFAEGAKAVISRQAAITQEQVAEGMAIARDLMTTQNFEAAFKKQIDYSQSVAQKTQIVSKELVELSVKSATEAFQVLRARAEENVAEMNALMKVA